MGMLNTIAESTGSFNPDNAVSFRESFIQTNMKVWEEDYADKYPSLGEEYFEVDNKKQNYIGALTVHFMRETARALEGAKRQFGEAVVQASLGTLNPRVLDVVRIFYPNMIAPELVDIQPLTGQVGQIFIMKPRYSNAVTGTAVGDEMFRVSTYPTYNNYADEANVDTVGTGDGSTTAFTYVAANHPMRPGTLVVAAGAITGTDNGSGLITGTGITSGTVDYNTGAVTVTFTTAPVNLLAVTNTYRWNSEIGEAYIRQVEFDLQLVPVTAKIHPLGFKFSVAAGLAAAAHLAIDVNDTLANVAATYIKIERDNKIVNLINSNAGTDSSLNFNADMTGKNYDKRSFFGEWEIKLDQAESLIQNTMGRGGLDFVIAGRNASVVIQNCRSFRHEPIKAPIGSHKIGTLRDGTVSVIKSLNMDSNTYTFGYKGYMAGDSATILAEWIPLYATPLFQNPTFNNQQGLMSMYDLFVNNSGYYKYGTLSNFTA